MTVVDVAVPNPVAESVSHRPVRSKPPSHSKILSIEDNQKKDSLSSGMVCLLRISASTVLAEFAELIVVALFELFWLTIIAAAILTSSSIAWKVEEAATLHQGIMRRYIPYMSHLCNSILISFNYIYCI